MNIIGHNGPHTLLLFIITTVRTICLIINVLVYNSFKFTSSDTEYIAFYDEVKSKGNPFGSQRSDIQLHPKLLKLLVKIVGF